MTPTAHPCPICGKSSSGISDGNGKCPYCLLQLGLSRGGTPSAWGTRASTHGGKTMGPEAGFLRQGVLPQFGDYELESEIARGGMGVVYRARQRSLNRVVAIKMILAGQLATSESVQRFRLEAEAAARLHHPGIVPIYEIGEHETQHFFSMELIDGVSLAECLQEFCLDIKVGPSEKRQQELCIAELLARVARALEFAHQRGVLHRDLKPSNILIDEEGQPHLTDFGLAKLAGREPSGLTVPNAVLGTPGYLAPEQAAGRLEVTTAADVYGLGATLYELLTGKPPFAGSTAVETMWMTIDQTPAAPRVVNPAIHRDLETIALRCLEKAPERRYRSAAAVADELERFIRREPIQARRVSRAEQVWRWCQRKPALASLAGALTIAILAGTAAALWQWRRAEAANVTLVRNMSDLEWGAIDDQLGKGEASGALAKVASLLRRDPADANAAMFAMSVLERRRFPVPAAPQVRHPGDGELSAARLSPDGRRIATSSYDRTARIWDAATSRELTPPLRHDGAVYWVEFSPDGKTLATCSADRTVRLWDAATGARLREPLLQDEPVLFILFSRDSRYLLARGEKSISVLDAADGKLLVGPLKRDAKLVMARFVAKGSAVFTAWATGDAPRLVIYDLPSGNVRSTVPTDLMRSADVTDPRAASVDHAGRAWIYDLAPGAAAVPRELVSRNGQIQRVRFSPDGKRVAVVAINHWARVYDAAMALPLTPELTHASLLGGTQFEGDDGRSILTWGADAQAQGWDAADGRRLFEPMRHANRVSFAESKTVDGQEVYLTTQSQRRSRLAEEGPETGTGAAQLWRIRDTSPPVRRDAKPEEYVHLSGVLSADGRRAALGKSYQDVWVVDMETGKPVAPMVYPPGGSSCLLFTPDHRRLVCASVSGEVSVLSLPDGKPTVEPVRLPTQFVSGEMSADGVQFLTSSTDRMMRLWDVTSGRVVFEMNHGAAIRSVAFSPDGRFVASAGDDRLVRLWDRRTGRPVRDLRGHGSEVTSVVFSPDARSVLTASSDFTAGVWDVETGQRRLTLTHQGEVIDALYGPDGTRIATASRDRTTMLWDAATGQPSARSLPHEKSLRNVRFSPDGRRLLTLDLAGLRLWDVRTGHPLTATLPQSVHGVFVHQSTSLRPAFTPDGESVFSAAGSPDAFLWHVPVPPAGAPAWFPEFLESVAGQRFAAGADRPELVPPENYLDLVRRLKNATDTDYYTRWAQQWLLDPPAAPAAGR